MAIFFGKDNTVWKVTACKIGEEPLSDGWYDLQGDDLKKIAIVGDFNWNLDLLPSSRTFEEECKLYVDKETDEWVFEHKGVIKKRSKSKFDCLFTKKEIQKALGV